MSGPAQILFPTGRLVAGSLYKPNDKDAEGRPLVIKNGPQAGQARVDYFFALAIPKQPGHTHWAQTDWGAQIWGVGHAEFPQIAASPTFAWKVKDGDSTIPNRKGKKPCDNEGWRGCWVVMFSGGFSPKVYQIPPGARDPVIWPEPNAVNLGDYVEVYGNVAGNKSAQQPGIFINHSMLCFRGYGERIVMGPDAGAVGFGTSAVPAGATTMPQGSTVMPPPPGAPVMPAPPVAMPAIPAAPAVVPVVPAIPAAAITPHLPVPPVATAPAAPVAPPLPPSVPVAPAGPVMTPKAAGTPYASFVAQGWTDAQMRQEGYIV